MSAAQFDIVFRGVREGFDATLVKMHFTALFKLEAEKTERIFRARKVTLKANLNESLANKYVARLAAIGVLVDIIPIAPEFIHAKPSLVSRAIYHPDNGEEAYDAGAMHQPVDFLYGQYTRRIPFVFTGRELTYLGIWLVNVLVCLLSAGILYPWARVRSLRYFYEHTLLDGAQFHYTSHSQDVLLLQFTLRAYLVTLIACFFLQPNYFVPGLVLLLVALPFYFHTCGFKSRHSRFCQLYIQQQSKLGASYIVLLGWPLAILFTAGLIAPLAIYRMQRYLVETKAIGDYAFQFSGNINRYLSLLPPLLCAHFVTAICFYALELLPPWFLVLVVAAAWLSVFIRWRVLLMNLQWNATSSKLGYFVADWQLVNYYNLVLRNVSFCILTLGLYWPWARIHSARYKAQHLAFFANQRFQKWRRRQSLLMESGVD